MGWTAEEFWSCTPRDFHRFYVGTVIRLTGKRPEDSGGGDFMSSAELKALCEKYPDG